MRTKSQRVGTRPKSLCRRTRAPVELMQMRRVTHRRPLGRDGRVKSATLRSPEQPRTQRVKRP